MPRIKSSPRFKKSYKKLPVEIQDKIKKAISLLAQNPRHPSLQTKPVQGMKGICEARVDINYRLSYERLPDDTLLLRYVSTHNDAMRNP
jgi:mRNA interferase RelE/StbE